jgi:mannitol-1-phosphate 5-dehydrogenase
MAPKLLQFGAGNIGRSFIGQLFSAAGYEVVFADVDARLIAALNASRGYTIAIRDRQNHDLAVRNVRAISVLDADAVARELADADICGTAVGPQALPKLFPVLAQALAVRSARGGGPLDFILCENLRDAARIVREGLRPLLPADFPLESYVGLAETSIGKMVPLIPEAQRSRDPLTVYAESYNTLILDRRALLGGVPLVPGLSPQDNMKAYVDRKAFIHNLGHAALGYFTFLVAPEKVFTYEAVEDEELRAWTHRTMEEAALWLLRTYPQEFTAASLGAHIEDLLTRFGNRSLGDTIHRVGRDLARKLSAEDRVAGALRACAAAGLPHGWIATALAAGLFFQPPDDAGRPFAPDLAIVQRAAGGPENFLQTVSGLSGALLADVAGRYRRIQEELRRGGVLRRAAFAALAALTPT